MGSGCESVGDLAARDLLLGMLAGEEDQVDFTDTQIGLIDRIGIDNHIQLKSSAAE